MRTNFLRASQRTRKVRREKQRSDYDERRELGIDERMGYAPGEAERRGQLLLQMDRLGSVRLGTSDFLRLSRLSRERAKVYNNRRARQRDLLRFRFWELRRFRMGSCVGL